MSNDVYFADEVNYYANNTLMTLPPMALWKTVPLHIILGMRLRDSQQGRDITLRKSLR